MPNAVNLGCVKLKDQTLAISGSKLIELIYGSFFTYYFNGKDLRIRNLNRLINKKEKNGSFIFQKFLRDKDFENFSGRTLGEFAEYTGYKLVFWAGVHYTNSTVKAYEIEPNFSVKTIHFLVPADYRNCITDHFLIEKLPKLSVVYNAEAVEQMVNDVNPNRSIIALISEKSGKSTGQVEFLLETHFPTGVPFRKERKFSEIFGFGFQISGASGAESQEPPGDPSRSVKIFKESFCSDFLNLEYVGQWQGQSTIQFSDLFRISTARLYACPNKWCTFPANQRKDEIDRHVPNCTNLTKFHYKHKNMVSRDCVREFLSENNFLSKDFTIKNFSTVDAETFGVRDSCRDQSGNTVELAEHKIVTLAFSSTFASDKVFSRQSYTENDYRQFFTEICAYIEYLGKKYLETLPTQVFDSFHKINDIIKNDDKKCRDENPTIQAAERLDPKMKSMLLKARRFLKKIMTLRIYGFGSERFDHPLILPGLLSIWKLKPKDLQVIKRASGLMQMSFNIGGQEISFQDARLYAGSGSLSKFTKTFGAQGSKGLFCYEFFDSIDQAKACTVWPGYKEFKSSLKYPNEHDIDSRMQKAFEMANNELDLTADQFLEKMGISNDCYELNPDPNVFPSSINYELADLHLTVDPVQYIENFIIYEDLSRTGVVTNLFDFLKWYNLQDCIILKEALQGFSKLFQENLKINPLEYITLPAMAERVMWDHFDDKIGNAFSLAEREINLMIRESSMGGLTAIIDGRHQEINVSRADRVHDAKVYTTPNGATIVEMHSWDYNNLYGSGMRDPMPVGHGIHYKKKDNGIFSWKPVQNPDKYSLDSIEWLNYEQRNFLKSDGSRHVIRHAFNHGEVEIRAGETRTADNLLKHKIYKPDGFLEVDGTQHFFEFDGCHHHECPHKCAVYQRFKFSNKNRWSPRSVEERNAFYRSKGVLHTITSCQWYRLRSSVSYRNYTSAFFRQTDITEEKILEKVATGDFFGLVKCDVSSPESVMNFFKPIGFAPVFLHKTVEEASIHPEYVNILKSNKRSFPLDPVLTVGFHGKDLLLTTEFLRYYIKIGINISNITEAVEFEKDDCFANFVNHVTEERKKATDAGNNPLQNIFKLVMNSSYGRTGMNLEKHLNVRYVHQSEKMNSNNLVKSYSELEGEFATPYLEVISRKRSVTDTIPCMFF